MGTDIHVLTERKYDGKWINCDNWRLNPYFGEDQSELMYDLNPMQEKRLLRQSILWIPSWLRY